ncbi:hypothetical protein IFM89_015214 [Coptis chinensis]|uniref:Uncharacterized protein n=1 Tax=Coptis chinensis TaxID=261450 RepID=A0A835H355_9MAGN|nr:hypothetical protein IFM89_015214 [Coptis chinensis]
MVGMVGIVGMVGMVGIVGVVAKDESEGRGVERLGNSVPGRDLNEPPGINVYPKSWNAIYVGSDNVGMWNIRAEDWAHLYLGQQFHLRVYSPVESWRDEYPIPKNALLCGRPSGRTTRPL